MLDRVHGDPCPRAGIDVPMVEVVGSMVEGSPVEQAMNQIEVDRGHEVEPKGHQHQIKRCLSPSDPRNATRGPGPEGECFVKGPDGHPARQTPEHVVANLVTPEELG